VEVVYDDECTIFTFEAISRELIFKGFGRSRFHPRFRSGDRRRSPRGANESVRSCLASTFIVYIRRAIDWIYSYRLILERHVYLLSVPRLIILSYKYV
jgi:hypothetical protein